MNNAIRVTLPALARCYNLSIDTLWSWVWRRHLPLEPRNKRGVLLTPENAVALHVVSELHHGKQKTGAEFRQIWADIHRGLREAHRTNQHCFSIYDSVSGLYRITVGPELDVETTGQIIAGIKGLHPVCLTSIERDYQAIFDLVRERTSEKKEFEARLRREFRAVQKDRTYSLN